MNFDLLKKFFYMYIWMYAHINLLIIIWSLITRRKILKQVIKLRTYCKRKVTKTIEKDFNNFGL